MCSSAQLGVKLRFLREAEGLSLQGMGSSWPTLHNATRPTGIDQEKT